MHKEYVALVLLRADADPSVGSGNQTLCASCARMHTGCGRCGPDGRASQQPPKLPQTLNAGPVMHWMERRERAPMVVSATPREGWLRCECSILQARFVVAGCKGPRSAHRTDGSTGGGPPLLLVEVRLQLHTGRTHQLRAQLAALGHPVVGDEMYGSPPLSALRAAAAAAAPPPTPYGAPLHVPTAWLAEAPFALHCATLRFDDHAYEASPPWAESSDQ